MDLDVLSFSFKSPIMDEALETNNLLNINQSSRVAMASNPQPISTLANGLNSSGMCCETSPVHGICWFDNIESQLGHFNAFAVFPLLPTEVRLKIWGFAARVPRVIELRPMEHACVCHPNDCPWYTTTPPPALAHTCVEAREVLMRTCKLYLSNTLSPAIIFFDAEIDSILFGSVGKVDKNSGSINARLLVTSQLCKELGPDDFQRLPKDDKDTAVAQAILMAKLLRRLHLHHINRVIAISDEIPYSFELYKWESTVPKLTLLLRYDSKVGRLYRCGASWEDLYLRAER